VRDEVCEVGRHRAPRAACLGVFGNALRWETSNQARRNSCTICHVR
jgi:hypothetical protein